MNMWNCVTYCYEVWDQETLKQNQLEKIKEEIASLVAQTVKNLSAMWETGFTLEKIPWRREWQPTPVFLPGEFHGHRSLVGWLQRDQTQLSD